MQTSYSTNAQMKVKLKPVRRVKGDIKTLKDADSQYEYDKECFKIQIDGTFCQHLSIPDTDLELAEVEDV